MTEGQGRPICSGQTTILQGKCFVDQWNNLALLTNKLFINSKMKLYKEKNTPSRVNGGWFIMLWGNIWRWRPWLYHKNHEIRGFPRDSWAKCVTKCKKTRFDLKIVGSTARWRLKASIQSKEDWFKKKWTVSSYGMSWNPVKGILKRSRAWKKKQSAKEDWNKIPAGKCKKPVNETGKLSVRPNTMEGCLYSCPCHFYCLGYSS